MSGVSAPVRPVRRPLLTLSVVPILAALAVGGLGFATASIEHPDVVSKDAVDWTPHLAPGGGVDEPLGLAVGQLGDTTYLGGRFEFVQDATRSTTVPRQNMVAFSASDGTINATFVPTFDDAVYAILAVGDSVYVGGSFDDVNGQPRPALAKLDATTGALDPGFSPNGMSNSRVSEIRLVDGRLIVSGTFKKNIVALKPNTGGNTGFIDIPVDGRVELSVGKTDVYRFAVDHAVGATRLVAVGNFFAVGGRTQKRAFMLNLDGASATLSPWFYPPFQDQCETRTPTRVAYLEDVDFSPDGSYFVFASTGFVVDVYPQQIGTHVCDAVARFETDVLAPTEPTWINYTGGDTLHAVAATGAAVYVQGHNRWLDNPEGRDSMGLGAVVRRGIGAVDPETGVALPWNPRKPADQGGRDFLATPTGLWVPSDSLRFQGEDHHGIAFVPLP